jgi:hypothetical protein
MLMAPQTTEFGAKVGLLAGLVLLTPLRWVFDRVWARDRVESEDGVLRGLATRRGMAATPGLVFARGAIVGSAAILLAATIVAAGAPARVLAEAAPDPGSPSLAVQVDPETLPEVSADLEVSTLNTEVDLDDLAVTLAENLEIEAMAIGGRDSSLLPLANGGRRLSQMIERVDQTVSTGVIAVPGYQFDGLHAVVIPAVGGQKATIGLQAAGSVEWVTYDAGGQEQAREQVPFETTFVLSPVAGDRWLIIEERPEG